MACFTLILLALLFAPFYINSGVSTLPEFMVRPDGVNPLVAAVVARVRLEPTMRRPS